jgi:hypothetical protein
MLRQVVDHCATVNKNLKNHAWQTQLDWWKRNGSFVEAAEFGFSYNLITLNGNRQSAGSRYAMALAMDVALEAETLANPIVKASDKMLSCEGVLAEYNEGKMDLSKNRDLYKLLLSLDQQKGRQASDLLIRQAQVVAHSGEKYSRSSITAERLVGRNVCPGPQVNTLKADWPAEIFEATCPDKSVVLVSCEWGNCKIRD